MTPLMFRRSWALCGVLLIAVSTHVFGQAEDEVQSWFEPTEPMRIIGPINFVGTRGLAVFLMTTSEGHILLNAGMPKSASLIESSIRKLGYRPEDIKIMLTCHAHIDHVGTHAYFKKLSGAQVAIMNVEVDLLESGGKTDFHYAHMQSV
jgi:metallo-beta-lactamase class B